jgi:hypothetical protein
MWVKLDDNFPEDERVLALSDKAFRLHVAGLCACGRNLTDGVISVERSRALLALVDATRKAISELEMSGLWEGSGPWTIRRYLDYNPSKESVELKRRAQREGGRRGSAARWGDRSTHDSTHDLTHGSSDRSSDDLTHGLSQGVTHDDLHGPVPVPVPVPSLGEVLEGDPSLAVDATSASTPRENGSEPRPATGRKAREGRHSGKDDLVFEGVLRDMP